MIIAEIPYFIPDGVKTLPMLAELNAGIFLYYDRENALFFHRDTYYNLLKGNNASLSEEPLASMSSSPVNREIITLDPTKAPLLNEKYQELYAFLSAHPQTSVEATLQLINQFVRTKVFDPALYSENHLEDLLEEWIADQEELTDFTLTIKGTWIPVLPIDFFIQKRCGVCRHYALVTGYFLDKLVKDPLQLLPPGRVHYVRDLVKNGGGHAWNFYLPTDSDAAWVTDSTWNIVKNALDPSHRSLLDQFYGKRAIENQLERFLHSQ